MAENQNDNGVKTCTYNEILMFSADGTRGKVEIRTENGQPMMYYEHPTGEKLCASIPRERESALRKLLAGEATSLSGVLEAHGPSNVIKLGRSQSEGGN